MAEEVVAIDERRHCPVVEADRDDAVGRLQVIEPVVLQHRQHPAARGVDAQVRETEAGVAGQRAWRSTGIDAHQMAVGELGMDDQAIPHGPGTTAVLVDPRAHVGWRRGQLGDRTVGRDT